MEDFNIKFDIGRMLDLKSYDNDFDKKQTTTDSIKLSDIITDILNYNVVRM